MDGFGGLLSGFGGGVGSWAIAYKSVMLAALDLWHMATAEGEFYRDKQDERDGQGYGCVDAAGQFSAVGRRMELGGCIVKW